MTIRGPLIPLNNGVEMPAIGLGVFQTPPDATTAAVEEALRLGYRHVDTAAAYGNEREVGEGIRRSGLARDEVFIETKVWISDYGYDETLHAFGKSARQARRRADRPPAPAPGAALRLRPHPRRLARARDAARRRQGAGDRRQQLHARASRPPARRGFSGAGREPDRAPSLLPAEGAAAGPCRAWHPDPGLVADRRHYLLSRRSRGARSTTRRCGRSRTGTARRPPRSCCAGTSTTAAARSPSRSVPTRIAENFDVFDFALSQRRSPQSTRSTPAFAADPTPTASPSKPTAERSRRREAGRELAWPWSAAHLLRGLLLRADCEAMVRRRE